MHLYTYSFLWTLITVFFVGAAAVAATTTLLSLCLNVHVADVVERAADTDRYAFQVMLRSWPKSTSQKGKQTNWLRATYSANDCEHCDSPCFIPFGVISLHLTLIVFFLDHVRCHTRQYM